MFYWLLKILLTPWLYLLWRMQVDGRANVPRRGPAILACNHVSFLENLLVPSVLLRRVTYVAKAEYFESWKTKWFFAASGQIPIPRTGGSASDAALEAAAGVLEAGHIFGIYPEGTRSPDGRLYRGKTGVARLALETGAPLIPVGAVGTGDVLPPGKRLPRPGKVVIEFGEPIDVDKYRRWPDEQKAARALTDELMFRIRELTDQEYVDRYASRSESIRRPPDVEAPGTAAA